jgi:hypothetical protein
LTTVRQFNKNSLGYMSVHIPAAEIEFVEGSHTIWVHSPKGGTVLRIKCTGKIRVQTCKDSPISHGDIMVDGDITICMAGQKCKKPHKQTTKA